MASVITVLGDGLTHRSFAEYVCVCCDNEWQSPRICSQETWLANHPGIAKHNESEFTVANLCLCVIVGDLNEERRRISQIKITELAFCCAHQEIDGDGPICI